MRRFTVFLVPGLILALGGAALADVTVKNKDPRDAPITIRRSNSRMDDVIKAKTSVALPGAPLTIILKKNNATMDAADGETVVIEKGKLSKIGVDGEEAPASPAPTATPAPSAEASPAEK